MGNCEPVPSQKPMPVNNGTMDKTSIRKQDRLAAGASTQPRQFFRASSRIFCLNGEWFFQAREDDHGPFTCREAAEQALTRYTAEMQELDNERADYSGIESAVHANQFSL